MSSPYIPPQAESPILTQCGASRGDRIGVRILGVVAVGAAMVFGINFPKEAVVVDSGIFESSSLRLLAILLLRHEGAIPLIAAVLLAGIGLFLSFRVQARTRSMLAFVCASFLLASASYLGIWFLIGEFVRATGSV